MPDVVILIYVVFGVALGAVALLLALAAIGDAIRDKEGDRGDE